MLKTFKKPNHYRKNIVELIKKRTARLNREIDRLRLELAEYKRKETSYIDHFLQENSRLSAAQILHKTLEELEFSHSQFEAIFAAQNDVVILYDTKMNVYRANPSFLTKYGFNPTGLNVKDIIRQVSCRWLDGGPIVLEEQPTPRALRGERVTGAQFIVRKADGSEEIVEASSGPVRIGEKIVGSVTVWHDITELKRVEGELLAHKEHLEVARRESEVRYQDLFKNFPGAIILHDGAYILAVNPAVGVLLKYENPDELIGTKVLDIVAPDYRELVSSRIKLIFDQEISTTSKEIHLIGRDGSRVYAETVAGICHYHGRKVIQVIFHDFTERKKLEIKLINRSTELFHALVTLETMLDTIPVGVLVAEAGNERISYFSPAAQEIMGGLLSGTATRPKPGGPRGIKMLRLDRSEIPPDDWPLARGLRKGENTENEEIIIQRHDGREVTTIINCAPVRDEQGRVLRAVSSIVNITKRKQMENALRESEARFRALAEALPQLVWITDAAGNFTYLNQQVYHYTGIPTEELLEKQAAGIFHPDDMEKRAEIRRKAICTGNTYQIEYRIRRYDGEYRWFLVRGLPMRDEQQNIIAWIGSCTDIHYQKQLELELKGTNRQLHTLSKEMMITLEEERRMISRELHDEAGQALTALKLFIEFILKGIPPDALGLQQKISEAVNLTDQTLKAIRRLAQELRPPGLDALGLNFTLEDFCYDFGKRVGLKIKYQGCELPILTDTVRISLYRFLQEALTNVVKHAKADSVYVRLGYYRQQISLFVKDNGIGFELEKAALNKKNMGLVGMKERLAILGGKLIINSKPGQGTRLMATIPREAVE